MSDDELIAFLRWALPRMGLRFAGFKNFRGTVRKRIARRLRELALPDLAAYRARLESAPEEQAVLDAMCRITISRLYRDRAVMETLRDVVLPAAADRGRSPVRVWSAGCASGEEPYTIALLWHVAIGRSHPAVAIEIVATDADAELIGRARRGRFAEGSLRELPQPLREVGLEEEEGELVVREHVRAAIDFRVQDVRRTMPDGPFDVVLCRNVAFTYLDELVQREVGARIVERLAPGGVLVIGQHESLPEGLALAPLARAVYSRIRE